ncbi:MAG: type VI secretion system tip protein TssI/VgrG [Fibrobacteria bacterium]
MPSSTSLKFSLKIGALAPDKFRVLEFTLNEAVSECFHLRIQAASGDGEVPYADMIGKEANLIIEGRDFPIKHFGVVTEFNQYPDASENFGQESYLYDIVIEPHFRLLVYNTQSRIFLKKKLPDILKEVFKANNLAASSFEMNLTGTLREREYTVQYNETDLNFVCRLLEDEGISFHFDHTGDTDKLILSDNLEAVKPIPETPTVELLGDAGLSHLATANQSADHVSKMRRNQRMVTGTVTIKDFNDRTPEVKVIGKVVNPGQGEYYAYGPQALNTAEAERIAQIRSDMHSAKKIQLEGEGICRAFRAGMRFELKAAGHAHFEGKFLLLRVIHHGDQREGFETTQEQVIYSNSFHCIPANAVFRPSLLTPKPRIHGILSAKVDGMEGQYAYLDDDGRYHAKLPFDLTDAKDGQASLPVRLNQPYGGPNYGMHFPVHNGNEMVLGFEDGDPDRPIMLGTVPNPSNGSPVNKRNVSESIIRTASGHQIRLDDKDGKTVIEILTKGKHVLTLNDDPDHQEVHLKTTDGNELVFDDKHKNIRMSTPDGAHLLKMDYDKKCFTVESKYGHKLTMDDESKRSTLQTKDGHILDLNDDKQLISIQDGKGKHVFQIDAGSGVVSITTAGDMEFLAKGALNISAREITLEAEKGAVNVKAAKDLVLDGMNVSAKGRQKVTLEAGLDASIKGLNLKMEGTVNVESKAGVQNKVTGVMTNVEAQGINTVKGAMVMIN